MAKKPSPKIEARMAGSPRIGKMSDDDFSDPAVVDDKYAQKKGGHRRQPQKLHQIAWDILIVISFLGVVSRLFRLDNPHYVVFDEVHFGKFGSYYLRGDFFFDVHPPLGKLLVALSGWIAGYDGNYLFGKIGEDYLTISKSGPVPYYTMRLFPAVMGAMQVPLAYLTTIELGGSNMAAVVSSCLFLFDNAQITQTRLILLDASLTLFIVWTMFSYAKFRNLAHVPFSFSWAFWLFQTGVGLGCAVSVKFVGLFIIATVGLHTVHELWTLYSDRRNSLDYVWEHFIWRAVCLIAVPVSIFLGSFYIHLAVLTNSGPGDSHMSAGFQSGLIGNSLNAMTGKMPREVAYGATITLKNANSKPSCWLHSHPERYPRHYNKGTNSERVSSAQQQVTCYPHNDHNNQFAILPADVNSTLVRYVETKPNPNSTAEAPPPTLEIEGNVKYVKNGDIVKLFHMSSRKLLNSHDVASPTQPSKQEVSCWNASEALAGQTTWKVVFAKGGTKEHWAPFRTHVKFEHVNTKTIMELSGEELPEWGFKQKEVVSSKVPRGTHETWFVDNITDPRLPAEDVERMEVPGFFSKMAELLPAMLESNSKLTSKHVYSSRPQNWPFLTRGVSFYQSKEHDAQIYLLGNFVAWWGGHLCLGLFMLTSGWLILREARGFIDFSEDNRRKLTKGLELGCMAWALHYLPFFNMDRQLFLHHYLPAVYFVFLVAGLFVDVAITRLPRPAKIAVVTSIVMVVVIVFILMAPMSYALNANGWEPKLRIRRAWDFKTFEKKRQ